MMINSLLCPHNHYVSSDREKRMLYHNIYYVSACSIIDIYINQECIP